MKKIALVIAFVLPFVFFTSVLIFANIANSRANPSQDYIYFLNPIYDKAYYSGSDNPAVVCSYDYFVENQKLKFSSYKDSCTSNNTVNHYKKFYRHNTKENKSSEISVAQAQKLKLNSDDKSKDGYTFEFSNTRSFIFSDNSDNSYYYLLGNGVSVKQNLDITDTNNTYIRFLGWVIED